MKKISLKICRSCGRDNPKSAAIFRSEEGLRCFYEPRVARGFFGALRQWADLEFVDCLTNCDTPNSVSVCCQKRTFEFAWISTLDLAEQVVAFSKSLAKNPNVQPQGVLRDHLLDKSTGRGKAASKNHPLQPQAAKPIWTE